MMKIKASLTNNIGIKIVAVLIAALIWLTVVNISDPEKTVMIYNVPIITTHENTITDMGMVYYITSKTSVNLTVSGKRSVVSKLSSDDFEATASLKELSKVNSIPVEVQARSNSVARNITIVTQSVKTLTVNVEELQRQQFNIEVEYTGSAAPGFIPGNYTLSRNTVRINAPVSVIDRIGRVVTECNLDGTDKDISQRCSLILYDRHGKEIRDNNITLSSKKVTVNVDILKQKEVPITLETLGKPEEGYQVESVKLSLESITISGEEDVIDAVEAIDLSEDVDIARQNGNFVEEIDLTEHMPDGVSIQGESVVRVNIIITKLKTKTLRIDTSNIKVNHLNEGLECDIVTKTIKVVIRGASDVIKNIAADDLDVSIDLEEYKEGTVNVPLDIKALEGVEVIKQNSVKVRLNK